MTERRITSADGQGFIAVDERGRAINPTSMEQMDSYLDSVGMPQEFRARARMTLLGHRSDLPTMEGAEHRSDDPTDENSPNFDPDEWLTVALRRSAAVAEEINATADEKRE